MDQNNIFTESPQIKKYDRKENRVTLDSFYDSERITLERVLPDCQTVMDIGCLNGETYGAIKKKYDIAYSGVDVDPDAIEIAKKNYSDAEFIVGDFMEENFTLPPKDLVLALNLFDHFEDWKAALRNLRRFASKYINFSSLLRLNGPTVVDRDLSYIWYGGGKYRLLWAAHNIFELAAYCGTEEINASSIFVYAYHKFNKYRFDNMWRMGRVCQSFDPRDLLVGNVVIELDESKCMSVTDVRPDLVIVVDDKVVFDSPWKEISES